MRAHSGGELKLQGPRVKQATRDSRATVEEGVSEIGSEIELAVGSYTKNGIYLKEPVKTWNISERARRSTGIFVSYPTYEHGCI